MATIPSSVVTTASIYTTTVPLCQGTVENHQLCATSTVTLPIQVTIPPVVAHTVVQPTTALSGTITMPAVTPTVTPITSSANMGLATACAPAMATTLVKTMVPTSLPDRHVSMGDGAQVLTKQRLQDLVKEVDPNEQLDDDVEEVSQLRVLTVSLCRRNVDLAEPCTI
ncbi:hypothetical protein HPB48_020812 [Haemaphysalis longicornis]|uniref:Uncharacterized protein n=1 Tax=Haemaphysalis longicornis TaxID=44386 RepID=A0A9J6H1F4_HAELO|nr:hypothetical protein HPB48_020812 [Haemaphysalis longicornis]